MAEVVAKYKLDVNDAVKNLNNLQNEFKETERASEKAGKTAEDSFVKGSNGAKRLERELRKQPKTLAEMELKLRNLRELLRDDTNIGTKGFRQIRNEIDKTEKEVSKLNGGLKKTGKEAGLLGKTFKQVGGMIAAAFAIDRLIDFGKEAISLAAKAEGVETAFANLDRPELLDNLRRATRGTVTDLELMRKAVQANNFRIPLDQLAKYFQFATNRSIQTGESIDDLTERIVTGIGRKSVRVLDDLGFSLQELQNEVKLVGDFGEAVGNIIDRELSGMGMVADTTSVKLARLTATWKNFTKEVGDSLIVLGDFILKLDEVGRVTNRSKEALEGRVKTTAQAGISVAKLSAATGEEIGLMQQTRILLFGLTDAEEELIAKYERSIKAKNEDAEATRKGNGAITEYVRSLAQLNTELKTLQEEFQNAEIGSDAWWNALDKIDKKTQEVFEATALSNLSDALKVDVETDDGSQDGVIQAQLDFLEKEFPEATTSAVDYADKKWREHFQKKMEMNEEEYQQWLLLQSKKKQEQELETQRITAAFEATTQILSSFVAIQGAAREEELRGLEDQLEQGLISREEYDIKRRRILQQQAEDEKAVAIFDATINGFAAVVSAYNVDPTGILAGITAAIVAAQVAAIAAQPIPQFAKGVIDLKGKGTETSDDIPAMLSRGESVMTARETKSYKDELMAIRNGGFEKLILTKYIKPMIDESLFKGFGDIGKSAKLNGITANLKDHNILHGLDRLRQSQMQGFHFLAKELKQSQPKRGGYRA